MYQIENNEDTIAAIATVTGQGGIGIVRLSGKNALEIADKIFISKSGRAPSALPGFTVRYGDVVDPESRAVIDEALLTVMRATASYTREDIAEISCHGGTVVLRKVLEVVTGCGARLARPGEFTKRAFLNGRIDLAQAEAVLDIIQAKTDACLRMCTHQLKGELSTELEALRERLMEVYVEIEAIVNFPEDEIKGPAQEQRNNGLAELLISVCDRIEALLKTADQGRILREGIKVVLCGKTNAGKSSLLNVLLRAPRAIVSEIAGTTRDTIEETAQIQGIPFQLVDTAGILEPRDLIEEEAIRRSRSMIDGADLVLFIFDAAGELTAEDRRFMRLVDDGNVLVVLNKCDLPQNIDDGQVRTCFPRAKVIRVSALKHSGIETLEQAIVEHVWHDSKVDPGGLLVNNLRHVQALRDGNSALRRARAMIVEGVPLEFVSEEVKAGVNALDAITGKNIDSDLLDTIFDRFCIGK